MTTNLFRNLQLNKKICIFFLVTVFALNTSAKNSSFENPTRDDYQLFSNFVANNSRFDKILNENLLDPNSANKYFSKIKEHKNLVPAVVQTFSTNENRVPATTTLYPYFLMTLGFLMWKFHLRMMRKKVK